MFNYHSDPEGLDYDGEDGDDDSRSPLQPQSRLSLDPDASNEFTKRPSPRLSTTPGSGGGGARGSTGGEDSTLNDSTLDDSISSIELPRRAPPDSYLNRMSFGFRLSDNFADLEELGAAGGDETLFINENDDYDDYDVAAEADESTENIWEGLDLGDSTKDLNRQFLPDEEAGEVGGELDEDSLGGFQLMVPELVGDEYMGGGGGEGGGGTGDVDGIEDRTPLDGYHDALHHDLDDPAHEYTDLFSHSGAYPAYPLSLSLSLPNNGAEQTSTYPSSPKTKPGLTNPLRKSKPKPIKLSCHNLPIPSLPPRLIKKLATNFAGSAGKGISNETLAQIIKASDTFFENACVRLGEFAEHAGRKTVGEGDVELLMKRYVSS